MDEPTTIRFYSTRTEYGYFSNFSPHPFTLKGKVWPTVEHYFQAQKFAGTDYEDRIRAAKGAMNAAKLGRSRKHPLRRDWEKVKEDVMHEALQAKFTQHRGLKAELLETGDATLIEDSPTDTYWGCGRSGKGKNRLGVLLMRLRTALREAGTDPLDVPRVNRTYRRENGKTIPGTWLYAFIHNGDRFYLTQINIYQDGIIDCWGKGSLADLEKHLKTGWVTTSLPKNADVSIFPYGDFRLGRNHWKIEPSDFLQEVKDTLDKLNGRGDSSDRCLEAWKAYTNNPSDETRAALRDAYEAVPEQNRMFVLRDQDVKDIPIRMAIYGGEEIEGWSHRAVARALGETPLPTIEVPGVETPNEIRRGRRRKRGC